MLRGSNGCRNRERGAGGQCQGGQAAAVNGASTAGAIVVMGVSASGKTTLGRLLAKRLAAPFIEGDALHSPANVAKMRSGQPLEDADRWPWLDQIGAALHAATAGGGMAVAACSALKFIYRERLRQAVGAPVSFILLDAREADLVRRLGSRSGHFMPTWLLGSQLATLEYPRASERALVLDASLSPDMLCEASCNWLLPATASGSRAARSRARPPR